MVHHYGEWTSDSDEENPMPWKHMRLQMELPSFSPLVNSVIERRELMSKDLNLNANFVQEARDHILFQIESPEPQDFVVYAKALVQKYPELKVPYSEPERHHVR